MSVDPRPSPASGDGVRQGHALIAGAMISDSAGREPSPYVVARLAEHVGHAGMWAELADQPYLLDELDPDSVAAAVLRSAYGRRRLPPPIAAALSARHLLNGLAPPDRLMTRWLAAACGWDRGERDGGEQRPLPAWAHIDHREPAHVALVGHRAPVRAVTPLRTAEGVLVASWAEDATIRVWDPATGRPAGDPISTGDTRLSALAGLHAENGGLLAGAGPGGAVTVWRWRSGEVVGVTGEAPGGAGLLAVLRPSGGREVLCAAAQGGDTVQLREVGLARVGVLRVPGRIRALTGLTVSESISRLVTGGYDAAVRFWDAGNGAPAGSIRHPQGAVTTLVATGTRPELLAAGENGGLHEVTLDRNGYPAAVRPLITYSSPRPLLAAVLDQPGEGAPLLAVADRDVIRLWRRANGTWAGTERLAGHGGTVRAVVPLAFPDGRRMLITAGDDTTVRMWHPRIEELAPAADEGLVVACAANDVQLVTGTDLGQVRWWDLTSGRPHDRALPQPVTVRAMAWGGDRLAIGGTDGNVRVSGAAADEPVWDRLHRHRGRILSLVAFRSRSGAVRFASGGVDSDVRVWDGDTGRAVGPRLADHPGQVREIAAVPDGERGAVLLAGCRERTVRVWREVAGDQFEPFDLALSSPDAALAVAGTTVVVGTEDGTVELRRSQDLTGRIAVHRVAEAGHLLSLAVRRVHGRWLLAAGHRSGRVSLSDLWTGRTLRNVLLPLGQQAEGLAFGGDHLVVRTGRGVMVTALDPRLAGESRLLEPQVPPGEQLR